MATTTGNAGLTPVVFFGLDAGRIKRVSAHQGQHHQIARSGSPSRLKNLKIPNLGFPLIT